jgi:hypothetical protein
MRAGMLDGMVKYKPIDCGPVAVAKVNEALGLTLKPGHAHFSASAQEHAEDRHPADFALCLAHITQILRNPEWVEQAPRQKGGFAMVSRVQAGKVIVLIALKIEPDAQGRYIVSSAYRLTPHDVAVRVMKGYMKPV